jgi:hypothetical protein
MGQQYCVSPSLFASRLKIFLDFEMSKQPSIKRRLFALLALMSLSIVGGCAAVQQGGAINLSFKRDSNLVYVWFVLEPGSLWQKNVNAVGAVLIETDGKTVGTLKFGERALIGMPSSTREVVVYVNEMYPLVPFLTLSSDGTLKNLFRKSSDERAVVLRYKTGETSLDYKNGNYQGISSGSGNLRIVVMNRLAKEHETYPVSFVHEDGPAKR